MSILKGLWSFLSDPLHRTRAVLVSLGAVLASGFFITAIYAWEFTSTPQFCGTTCHTMPAEYSAYQRSPHARVDCVNCHVPKGVNSAVAQKISDVSHVIGIVFHNYETPIVAQSLRPAREVCERCHWPEKFYGDKIRKIVRFLPDEKNTEVDTYLIMKTGGGTSRVGKGYGIHWHIENQVEYITTDRMKQSIPWVRVTFPNGKQVEYLDATTNLTKEQIERSPKRQMDCMDCHNRASHYLKSPDLSMDEALASGQIDKTLPEIKKKGVEVLEAKYSSLTERLKAIDALEDFYRTNYPQVYAEKSAAIKEAIAFIKQIEVNTDFPQLQVDWRTYPNNVGHKEFPGCFRCHDGKHIAQGAPDLPPERLSIRLQCNICHSIPETVAAGQQPQFTSIIPKPEPAYHARGDWMARHPKQLDATCATCHGEIRYSARPTLENQSFCANISCHGTGWKKYIALIDINVPGQVPLPSPIVPPSPTPTMPAAGPTPIPSKPAAQPASGSPALPSDHAGRTPETCLVCHGPSGLKPLPVSHAGRTAEACLACHK